MLMAAWPGMPNSLYPLWSVLGTYLLIPAVYVAQASAWTAEALWPLVGPVAQALFLWTALVVVGRVAYLVGAKGAWLALVWFVKLVTDPVTDLLAYSPRYLAAPKAMFASRGRNGGSR